MIKTVPAAPKKGIEQNDFRWGIKALSYRTLVRLFRKVRDNNGLGELFWCARKMIFEGVKEESLTRYISRSSYCLKQVKLVLRGADSKNTIRLCVIGDLQWIIVLTKDVKTA
jgi:hypothetical protein